MAGDAADVDDLDHLHADHHHQGGEDGQRDQLQRADQQPGGEQHPHPVEDGRVAADRAGLDVRRGAHRHSGDRQPAQGPGDHVGQALATQLPVQIGAWNPHRRQVLREGAGDGQLVGGHRRQQRLHTGDQGDGQHGGEQPQDRPVGQGGEGVAVPGRQVHAGQPQVDEGRHRGRRRHRGQRGREHPADPFARPTGQPRPQQDDGHREDAHRQGVGTGVGQLSGQGQHVGDGGALRASAEHDVQLGEGDRHADARDHAVHDRGADHQRGTGRPQRGQAELGEPGEHRDGARGAPAVPLDQFGDDHRQARGRPADLEGRATEASGDDAADGRRDQARLEGRAGGQGDAQGEGHGDEEDGHGGREIGGQGALGTTPEPRRAGGGIGPAGTTGGVGVRGAGRGAGGHIRLRHRDPSRSVCE